MEKNEAPMTKGQSPLPDAEIQEQIKLDIPVANVTDTPIPERQTGNVIDISGDLIDKIMAQQTVCEADISAEAPAPEGGQEWEKPQEEEKKPRRGRPPKDKEAPAQGDKPKRKGRPPKAEKQAPGGGGPGKSAKAPRQSKPGPAKEDPAPPPPAPEQPPRTAKLMAALCYLNVLILIPACTKWRHDEFVKFHLNQGLVVLALATVCACVGFLPHGSELGLTLTLLVDVLSLVGLVQTLRGLKSPLPGIWRITRAFHPFN